MEGLPINVVDAAAALVLLFSAALAFFRGMVHELLAVVSWVGAAFATLYGYSYVQPVTAQYITVQLLADVTAGVVIFVVTLIVLSLATRIVSRRVQESSLGPLDRSLGLVFGIARGAVILAAAWLALTWWLPEADRPDWIQEARSRPLMEEGGRLLLQVVPEELLERSEEAIEDIEGSQPGFGLLNNPLVKNDENEAESGYTDADRGDMKGLIEEKTKP